MGATRRGLVAGAIGLGLVGILVAGTLVFDRSSSDRAETPSWDTVAAVDRRTGVVTYLDTDGEEGGDLDTGVADLRYVLGEGPDLALVGEGAVGVVDVAGETVQSPRVADDARAVRVPTSEAMALGVGSQGGGTDTVIVLASATIDVGAQAGLDDPLLFVDAITADPAGTLYGVPDLRSLQTVIVGPEREEAVLVPGLPVGLTGELAATVDSGRRAELRFFALDGDEIGSTDVPRPAAAVVTRAGEVILVTDAGEVQLVGAGDEEAETIGTLQLEGEVFGGATSLDGRRVIVAADQGLAVLDDHGDVRSTLAFDAPLLRQQLVRHPSQRCVLVVTDAGDATMIDVESGDTLGVIDGVVIVNGTSLDGCTAAVTRRDDFALLRQGVELRLDRDQSVAAIAPDGDHVVVRDRDGRAWLRDLDDEASDIDLGSRPDALYAFVDR